MRPRRGRQSRTLKDEYGVTHRVWKISDPASIARIQALMADKKLLIADGHHRYETALAFRNENPGLKDAEKVMMTFVNMHSPGLEILATHRVLSGIPADLANKIPARRLGSIDELKQIFRSPAPDKIRIGLALANRRSSLYERDRKPGELDVKVLHEELLGAALGIGEEAVREQKHIEYVRGLDAAYAKVRDGGAQIAFLLEPVTVATGGGRRVFGRRDAAEIDRLLSEAAQRSDDLQAGAVRAFDCKDKFFHWLAADQMFLDDALDHFGRRRVIPNAIGVDHGDGAVFANSQAIGLGAIDAAGPLHQAAFGQAFFQIVPGSVGDFALRALGLGLIGAQKDVARERTDSVVAGDGCEIFFIVHLVFVPSKRRRGQTNRQGRNRP